jgi:hypothetical protein
MNPDTAYWLPAPARPNARHGNGMLWCALRRMFAGSDTHVPTIFYYRDGTLFYR